MFFLTHDSVACTIDTIARHENYAEEVMQFIVAQNTCERFVGRASRVGFRDRIPRIFQLRDSPPCTFSVCSLDCGEAQYPYQQFSPPLVAIAVLPSRGGEVTKTLHVPGFLERLNWSPDGKGLQYLLTGSNATNLWEQPLSGGKAKQLTHFTAGEIFDFSWALDRKHLFLTRGQSMRDLVLIEVDRQR